MKAAKPKFDEEIHAPLRLRVCALLGGVTDMEFSILREQLDVSDSVLSKHLTRLAEAGYVYITKTTARGHQRTRVRLTSYGRNALAGHLAALQEIAALADPAQLNEPAQKNPAPSQAASGTSLWWHPSAPATQQP